MSVEEDFGAFAVARGRSLRRLAFLLTGDHHHAEDLLQTTLTKVYLSWDKIRDQRNADAYARRILATTYTSWWRRRSWQERPADRIGERDQPDRTDDIVERAELRRLLHELPRQQRAVVVLRFYEDLTVADTAAALGIGVGTVKSYTSRALAAMRVQLGDTPRSRARLESGSNHADHS